MHDDSNYYRILQVQPDAPVEVIRHNYRLLLHKLRMHPDLGGSQNQATLINAAYETLLDPEKRAAYNLKLSRGPYPFLPFFPKTTAPSGQSRGKNRRNYYRVLQVHPDARPEIIRARYRALVKETDPPHDLFHEAFAILSDALKRARYDRLLETHAHVAVLEMMQAEDAAEKTASPRGHYPVPADPEAIAEYLNHPSPLPTVAGPAKSCRFQYGRMTRCCPFCKATVAFDSQHITDPLCPVCDSPMAPIGEEMFGEATRRFERREKKESIAFYPEWPGQKESGRLFDISPSGLRLNSEILLQTGQLIKIESRHFKAVAEVVHRRIENGVPSYGMRFRTVFFGPERGYFLSTKA